MSKKFGTYFNLRFVQHVGIINIDDRLFMNDPDLPIIASEIEQIFGIASIIKNLRPGIWNCYLTEIKKINFYFIMCHANININDINSLYLRTFRKHGQVSNGYMGSKKNNIMIKPSLKGLGITIRSGYRTGTFDVWVKEANRSNKIDIVGIEFINDEEGLKIIKNQQ